MKYYAFLLRDSDNNIVLVKPDTVSKELDYHVVKNDTLSEALMNLELNSVAVAHINEPQEDSYEFDLKFMLAHGDSADESNNLGDMSERDEERFRAVMERFYKEMMIAVVNENNNPCSTEIAEN